MSRPVDVIRASPVRRSALVKLLIGSFLLVTVVFPLATMLINMAGSDISAVLRLPRFRAALYNSFYVATTATIISISLAYVFALCIVRSNMRHREIFSVVVTLPMLIPSISHGMGLVLLLGVNGVITRLFGLPGTIYGFHGIIIGSMTSG